ncbi:hypothetical protein ElyMa_001803900 [Elysia marginata]|uniref:Uncharacterized protein n=1 Tax=Elysia marginata TaxID=1093978 RepID=A0AAV4EGD6_9GAST|nr:hypothetical protein ElyMa_001803900 [Elysia marginata]
MDVCAATNIQLDVLLQLLPNYGITQMNQGSTVKVYQTRDRVTLEMCDANGVILYGLLAPASHILQPFDLSVSGSMKAEWPNITKMHLDREEEMPSVTNFATLPKQVWELCAKPERAL